MKLTDLNFIGNHLIMPLTYSGTEKLLENLGLSTNEQLASTILNPNSYEETWKKVRQSVGHDYHDLSFLHDTLCFMFDHEGRLTKEGVLALRDDLQDVSDYTTGCVIPTLEQLGMIQYVPDNDLMILTDRGRKVQPQPRFVELTIVEG